MPWKEFSGNHPFEPSGLEVEFSAKDHRMNHCHHKEQAGDAIHAGLCASGYNIRWLLRMIRKKHQPFLLAPPDVAIGPMPPSYTIIRNHQTAFSPPNSDLKSIRLTKAEFFGATNVLIFL
jgi:hypothetical protein